MTAVGIAVNVTIFEWREIVAARACSDVDPRSCECLMKLRLEEEPINIPGPQPTEVDAQKLTLSNTLSCACPLAGFPLESVPTTAGRHVVIKMFSKVIRYAELSQIPGCFESDPPEAIWVW